MRSMGAYRYESDAYPEAKRDYAARGIDLDRVYRELKNVAMRRGTIPYMRLPEASKIGRRWIGEIVGLISEAESAEGRPLLSVVAVSASTGLPSVGFFDLEAIEERHPHLRRSGNHLTKAQRDFVRAEQSRAYEYWSRRAQ